MLDGVVHHRPHDVVRFTEGDAFLGEVVSKVRRIGIAHVRCAARPLCVHFHLGDHRRHDGETVEQRVDRIKNLFLVFGQVCVVGERNALHDGEHRHEIAVHAAGLAANLFGNVRILLLRNKYTIARREKR